MRTLRPRLVIAALLLVVVAGAVFWLQSKDQAATADDASHTTSLATGSHDFETGGGAQAAIIATLTSTSSSDVLGRIYISHKPAGGSAYSVILVNESPTDNSQSGVDATAAITAGLASSGDQIQALFFTYDSSSNETFSHVRTITIP